MSGAEAWHTMRCRPCGRDRVHWRSNSRWRCIGTLPDRRYVADCAEDPVVTARQIAQLSDAVRYEQQAAVEPDSGERTWLWTLARLLRRSAGQHEDVVRRSQAHNWRNARRRT